MDGQARTPLVRVSCEGHEVFVNVATVTFVRRHADGRPSLHFVGGEKLMLEDNFDDLLQRLGCA